MRSSGSLSMVSYLPIWAISSEERYEHGSKLNRFQSSYWCFFHFCLQFLSAHERYKAYKMATKKNYVPRRLGLIAQIVVYLLPGIVIFLFLPSLLFSYFEDWPYSVSIYYSFVTLTTIGFGDFVPTFQPQQVSPAKLMFMIKILGGFWKL